MSLAWTRWGLRVLAFVRHPYAPRTRCALLCSQRESELYCPFVTKGSYCILQDTKLSRLSTNGPMQAVKDFVAKYPRDLQADRSKEPFHTQHASG